MRSGPKRRKICGVGVNDANYIPYPVLNGVSLPRCVFHETWKGMITRCYGKRTVANASYKAVTVHPSWHRFSTFRKWMETQDYYGKEIDKDIINPGSSEYGPDNCCFVSRSINALVTYKIRIKSKQAPGSCKNTTSKKYRSLFGRSGKQVYLGSFDTPGKASLAYRFAKSDAIKEAASHITDTRISRGLLQHAYLIRAGVAL